MTRAHIRRAGRMTFFSECTKIAGANGYNYDCSILKGRENFCVGLKHVTRLFNNALEAEISAFNLICNF